MNPDPNLRENSLEKVFFVPDIESFVLKAEDSFWSLAPKEIPDNLFLRKNYISYRSTTEFEQLELLETHQRVYCSIRGTEEGWKVRIPPFTSGLQPTPLVEKWVLRLTQLIPIDSTVGSEIEEDFRLLTVSELKMRIRAFGSTPLPSAKKQQLIEQYENLLHEHT